MAWHYFPALLDVKPTVADMNEAFAWLPKSAHAAQYLANLFRERVISKQEEKPTTQGAGKDGLHHDLIHQRELVGEQEHLSEFFPWAERCRHMIRVGEVCLRVPAHWDACNGRDVPVRHRNRRGPLKIIVARVGSA